MAEKSQKQTHVAVLPRTQKQLSILSKVRGPFIYELVGAWADEAWEKAKKDGLVTDAMIQPQDKPSPSEKKSRVASAQMILAA